MIVKKTAAVKVLRDRAINIAKNAVENEITQNKELTKELHKVVIRKFEKQKVRSSFTDIILSADLADMQLWSKFNKGICIIVKQ